MGISLGLVGIRQRAKSIGARVEIESEPGRGTRVRVTIDRVHAAADRSRQ